MNCAGSLLSLLTVSEASADLEASTVSIKRQRLRADKALLGSGAVRATHMPTT